MRTQETGKELKGDVADMEKRPSARLSRLGCGRHEYQVLVVNADSDDHPDRIETQAGVGDSVAERVALLL